jgi:hypothetical protein
VWPGQAGENIRHIGGSSAPVMAVTVDVLRTLIRAEQLYEIYLKERAEGESGR